jgi:transposase
MASPADIQHSRRINGLSGEDTNDAPTVDQGLSEHGSQLPPKAGEAKTKFSRLPEGTVGRGYPIKLRFWAESGKRARPLLDLWRRRSMQLYNLVVELQAGAYSGKTVRSELGWREVWADMVRRNYASDLKAFREGGRRNKDGSLRKRKSTAPPKEPKPISEDYVARIRGHGFDPTLGPDGKPLADRKPRSDKTANGAADEGPEPAIFIPKRELMAIVDALKQSPLASWIGELPGNSEDKVCEDVDNAIKAMLRERRKAAAGQAFREWGFPKRKKTSRYAAGSIYFANTQFEIDYRWGRVRLSNGVGWIDLAHNAGEDNERRRAEQAARDRAVGFAERAQKALVVRAGPASDAATTAWREWRRAQRGPFGLPPEGSKIMGARVYRRGEDWWISIQAAVEPPKALPGTGKAAGVAVAAKVMMTVVGDDGRSFQIDTPKENPRRARRYRLAALDQSRTLEARKAKQGKINARKRRIMRHQGKVPEGKTPRRHVPMSRAFYRTSARMARLEARNTYAYDLAMKEGIAKVVRTFDAITAQRMDVAAMLKSPRAERHERREEAGTEKRPTPPKRVHKHLRKLNRRARMGLTYATLKRTAIEAGRAFQETHQLFPDAQICSQCGHINRKMIDGRPNLECDSCGHHMERRKNRARNELEQGMIVREATDGLKRPPAAAE